MLKTNTMSKTADDLFATLKSQIEGLEVERDDQFQILETVRALEDVHEGDNLDHFNTEDLVLELLSKSKAEGTLFNQMKLEKFFENIDRFTLEEFETFISTRKK